jgi:hypothetical protein
MLYEFEDWTYLKQEEASKAVQLQLQFAWAILGVNEVAQKLSYQTLNLQRKESRRLIVLRNSCLLIQD